MVGRRLWIVPVLALGCGGDRRDGEGSSVSGVSAAATESGIDDGGGSAGSDAGDASADGRDGTADDDGTHGDADDGTKFDLGALPDGGGGSCADKCGETGFSYIYIANSTVSMMSKINTVTMIEEGRYLTRPGGGGDPSRTAVSIDGQLGAINNRQIGGVLAVWTLPELCDPNANGQAGLQTSTGPADVLPWGQDDCVAWFTDIAGAMRPIAWVAGEYNERTCQYENQKLWTATSSNVTAYRLDRETGVIEDTVPVPGPSFGYGGAADAEGNFWIIDLGTTLARVDAQTLAVQSWTIPNSQSVYGVTVASDGRVWMSANMSNMTSAVRFTPATQTFDFATGPIAYAQSGIAEDGQGRMWMNHWGSPPAIYPIDKDTMQTGQPFIVQGATSTAKGIAVDRHGNVWTAHFDNNAYRMDVDNGVIDTVGGLDYPYTYSDMTGGALTGVTCGSPTG